MTTQIEQDMAKILWALSTAPDGDFVEGEVLAGLTGLDPGRINNAVTLLVESGLAEWLQTIGTAPYEFHEVAITPRGQFEHQKIEELQKARLVKTAEINPTMHVANLHPLSPVGSPYGFTDEDWEIVSERKYNADQLYVVLGHQFTSSHYDAGALTRNVREMFESAVKTYNTPKFRPRVALEFNALAAGYGEHLLNDIIRDIISADIAVFEMSDQNPNVMLEMGVALTWGVRVLPIKAKDRPRPPSDISGHTWADYENSALTFVEKEHQSKLVRMIERAMRKKIRTVTQE